MVGSCKHSNKLSGSINCGKFLHYKHTHINKCYYQQTAQQISLQYIYRLLGQVLATSYNHLQGTLTYKGYTYIYIYIYICIIHNVTSLAVNGKIHYEYIIKISMCGVDNVVELSGPQAPCISPMFIQL